MSKHTPGPWHATSSGEGLPLTRIGYSMRSVGGGYDSHCIALMSVSQRDDEQVSANARLIAAAPDLLEALITYVALDELRGTEGGVFRAGHVAIAKATGEQK